MLCRRQVLSTLTALFLARNSGASAVSPRCPSPSSTFTAPSAAQENIWNVSEFGTVIAGDRKWRDGVMAANGWAYAFPSQADRILAMKPTSPPQVKYLDKYIKPNSWSFAGGVTAVDFGGREIIYAIPLKAEFLLAVIPSDEAAADTVTVDLLPTDLMDTSLQKWNGAARAGNGKIYACPFEWDAVLEIDGISSNVTQVSTFGEGSVLAKGNYKWWGGVLAPNGNIYCSPHNAGTVLKIDPEKRETTLFGTPLLREGAVSGVLADSDRWRGAVMSRNGVMYSIPFKSENILRVDTSIDAVEILPMGFGDTGKWVGGVLVPSGIIYGIPSRAKKILKIQPGNESSTDVVTEIAPPVTSTDEANKWHGAFIAPSGIVYATPASATQILTIGARQCTDLPTPTAAPNITAAPNTTAASTTTAAPNTTAAATALLSTTAAAAALPTATTVAPALLATATAARSTTAAVPPVRLNSILLDLTTQSFDGKKQQMFLSAVAGAAGIPVSYTRIANITDLNGGGIMVKIEIQQAGLSADEAVQLRESLPALNGSAGLSEQPWSTLLPCATQVCVTYPETRVLWCSCDALASKKVSFDLALQGVARDTFKEGLQAFLSDVADMANVSVASIKIGASADLPSGGIIFPVSVVPITMADAAFLERSRPRFNAAQALQAHIDWVSIVGCAMHCEGNQNYFYCECFSSESEWNTTTTLGIVLAIAGLMLSILGCKNFQPHFRALCHACPKTSSTSPPSSSAQQASQLKSNSALAKELTHNPMTKV